ncbi:Heparinase II/III [Hyphomonas johnsonii MHS-2]|uniref:Heparinase II/III n=1 Tax=Hyphomonas johnsonii MHS-2 TaxID=1280950 RepID=A0A059FS10_9PROT|nr:Heparinase II/III [Hyphomonas johnsonii MHS-2]
MNQPFSHPGHWARTAGLALFGITLVACSTANPVDVHARPGVAAPSGETLFDHSIAALRASVDERRAEGVDVPVPVDAGGGYTHEQHKQNAKTIYEAGMLYQLTGESKYLDFAARILSDYSDLYPTLGLHPQVNPETPSRLFWQGLNEAMWLVYAVQGYDAIQDDLSAEQRSKIEDQLLRPMADFLSVGSPQTFDRIHNHGTWAAAAVGMTGYALGERDYVEKALYGLDKSGDAGFIKQVDALFSPDGYYAEGPYYQRFALMPFVLFAQAIERGDPELRIFEHRGGVLRKAITANIQETYGGRFFPINDAIREKGLNTAELRYAVAIAYDLTGDASLLSIAQQQKSIVPTPEGKKLSDAIAAGKSKPFAFKSQKLRDGPDGDRGALITLRSGPEPDAAALVFKATSQGLGHGHFDRLGLLYYDNGDEVVADYGAARFLNVEPKDGGRYLPENASWAKQTVAHNTLVVDQSSQFDGDWEEGEAYTPTILAFDDTVGASYAAAEITTAYTGVTYQRVVAMVDRDGGGSYVIDVVRGASDAPHTYDLPVHFKGQLIETNLPFTYAVAQLVPLGIRAGYQHLWKTAEASGVAAGVTSDLSFLIDDQFYTLTFTARQTLGAYLTRLGANDPNNNLRNEQAMILRATGKDATFLSVYERHGRYDNDEEVTVFSGGSVERLDISRSGRSDVYTVIPKSGGSIRVLFSDDTAPTATHQIQLDDQTVNWNGPVGLHISAGTEHSTKGEN